MSSLSDFSNIRVILVNTSHPGNIGATARAMKNMGLEHLHLVDPRDFPSEVATWRAVGAADLLEQAVVSSTLQEAVADCTLVIGASARSRRIPWPVLNPRRAAAQVAAEAGRSRVALVFGREDTGLTNEELQLCHYHVQIPADEAYSSLNLAAAVMVIIYEVRMALLEAQDSQQTGEAAGPRATEAQAAPVAAVHSGENSFKSSLESSLEHTLNSAAENDEEAAYWDVAKADGEQMELFYAHLEKVLIELSFHDPENPRLLMHRMRRLFGRIRPDTMEVNILRGILTYVESHIHKK